MPSFDEDKFALSDEMYFRREKREKIIKPAGELYKPKRIWKISNETVLLHSAKNIFVV